MVGNTPLGDGLGAGEAVGVLEGKFAVGVELGEGVGAGEPVGEDDGS